ncbi:MAG: 4'-phosphopantetheinyl transferase superfamily protein [Candidatus Hydrogenedentota bacterium]
MGLTTWESPPAHAELTGAQIDVWRIALDTPGEIGSLHGLLDDAERARADRFIRAEHGRSFTIAHAALRRILGNYLEIAPERVRFSESGKGKPRIDGDSDIEFNLSHSGELALVAVTTGRAVGVDIESMRERDAQRNIAERYFSRGEVDALFTLPEAEQSAAFYRCWTRKEAYIKALGLGLTYPLDGFEVSLDESSPRLVWSKEGDAETKRWTFSNLNPGPGYAGALAAEGPFAALRRFEFSF